MKTVVFQFLPSLPNLKDKMRSWRVTAYKDGVYYARHCPNWDYVQEVKAHFRARFGIGVCIVVETATIHDDDFWDHGNRKSYYKEIEDNAVKKR